MFHFLSRMFRSAHSLPHQTNVHNSKRRVLLELEELENRITPGFITPSGDPTGPSSVTSPQQPNGYYYVVSLNPTAATSTASSWSADALSAQGMDAAHGWTINYFDPQGDYRLDTYQAWAETAPAVVEPTISVGALNAPGSGGAELTRL